MHLFDQLPENLFSILASQNKRIYTDALFVLRDAFKMNLSVKREELVMQLMSQLEDVINRFSDEDNVATDFDLSGKANFLVRKLVETEWIRIEFMGDSFDEMITLPDYSVILLNALYEVTHEEKREYNALVVSTYNNLKNANYERNEFTFTTLERAYQDTMQLIDLLKTLFNNIGRYHQQLVGMTDVNAVLMSHFDEFKAQILDKIYHPLKTLDSVPRFRGPILEILNQWLQDSELIDQMINQALSYKRYEDEPSALYGILEKLHGLSDIYETIGSVIEQIDQKHATYTRATIEKIQYLISRDKTVKGKIVSVLQLIKASSEEDFEKIQGYMNLFEQGYVDHESLYNRSQIRQTRIYDPVNIKLLKEADKHKMVADFTNAIQRQYSNGEIKNYMADLMEKGMVSTTQMPLASDEDFMKLMLAAIKSGQSDMPFVAQYDSGQVKTDFYEVPKITFIKKGKDHVGK